MTAEIGVLNKTSVVLAADSAVTIGSLSKVFNNANKLFPLSNYEPVGIMIYNNASWMGIPMEIIIKSYTKHLGKKTFETLEEYRDDFIIFIKNNYQCFVTSEQIKDFIEYRLYTMLDGIMDLCKKFFDKKYKSELNNLTPIEKDELFEKTFSDLLKKVSQLKTSILNEFQNYKLNDFKTEFKSYFNKILPGFYTSYKLNRKAQYTNQIIKQLYHELICAFSEDEDYTGIVIAGYGSKEIFPTICDVKIGEIFSKRLRYEYSSVRKVDQKLSAIVRPFAQRDMIDTFFQGFNPIIIKEFEKILNEEYDIIVDKIVTKYPQIDKSEIRQHLRNSIKSTNSKIKKFAIENYVNPIITSIGYLRKEDLVELAESLINITSLKHKTSKNLQTVGGPIDIAIITKHEGFVWIKKKEIINPELNSIYYHRELKGI